MKWRCIEFLLHKSGLFIASAFLSAIFKLNATKILWSVGNTTQCDGAPNIPPEIPHLYFSHSEAAHIWNSFSNKGITRFKCFATFQPCASRAGILLLDLVLTFLLIISTTEKRISSNTRSRMWFHNTSVHSNLCARLSPFLSIMQSDAVSAIFSALPSIT